jgi:hypothetical protein
MQTKALLVLLGLLTTSSVRAQEQLQPTLGTTDDEEGTDVLGAFTDSLKLLLLEHASRIAFQQKTRAELGGDFWSDYRRSVRIPSQWEDTDAWWVNYIGHPVHGAAAGYIWLDHETGAPSEIGLSGRYWSSRARAVAFSATYSLQFEIGPLRSIHRQCRPAPGHDGLGRSRRDARWRLRIDRRRGCP